MSEDVSSATEALKPVGPQHGFEQRAEFLRHQRSDVGRPSEDRSHLLVRHAGVALEGVAAVWARQAAQSAGQTARRKREDGRRSSRSPRSILIIQKIEPSHVY